MSPVKARRKYLEKKRKVLGVSCDLSKAMTLSGEPLIVAFWQEIKEESKGSWRRAALD